MPNPNDTAPLTPTATPPQLPPPGRVERSPAPAKAGTPNCPPETPPPGRVERAVGSLAPDTLQGLRVLANEPTGFMTDRDPMRKNPETGLPWVPYTPDVLARCFLRMIDLGFKVIGNEVNIINGEPTVTLAGFLRRLRENEDVTALRESVSAPRLVAGRGWLVSISAQCEYKEKLLSVERALLIPGPGGPGGEWAARRARLVLYSLLHEQVTGQRLVPGEVQTEEQEKAILEQGPIPGVAAEVLFAQPEAGTVPHPGEVWGRGEDRTSKVEDGGKGRSPSSILHPLPPQPVLTLAADPTLPVTATVTTAPANSDLPSPISHPEPTAQARAPRLPTAHRKLRDYLVAQGFTFRELLNWVRYRPQFSYLGAAQWADWADIPAPLAASWNRDRSRVANTLLRFRLRLSGYEQAQPTNAQLN